MKEQIIMHLIFRIHHAAIELYAVITVILKYKLMNWQNMKITVEVVQNDVKIVENLWCWSISSYIWILTMLSWNLKMVTSLINFFSQFPNFSVPLSCPLSPVLFPLLHLNNLPMWLPGCKIQYWRSFVFIFILPRGYSKMSFYLFYANKDWASRTYFKTQS